MLLASLPDDLAGAPVPAPPLVVSWNVSRRCRRSDCVHCLLCAGSGGGAIGELSTVEGLHLIHQLLGDPSPILVLSGGDPLAREDIETIAAHAVRRGARVVVATTAARLTEKRLSLLVDAGIDALVVTIASLKAERHAGLAHGIGPLADVLSTVERARAKELPVIVQSLVSPVTRDEAGDLVAWCAERRVAALHLDIAADGFAMSAGSFSGKTLERVEQEIALAQRRRGRRLVVRTTRRTPALETAFACPCGPGVARITSDGKLTACPCASTTLADLRLRPFRDVWAASDVLNARRDVFAARAAAHVQPEPVPQLNLEFGAPDSRGRGKAR